MTRRLTLAVLLAFAFGAQKALAQCSISAAAMNLGTYTGTLITVGTTPLTVNCSVLTSYNVGLNQGTGAGATTTTRKMTGPAGAQLSYQMFQNIARTINWGNNTGVDSVAGSGNGNNQTLNVYPVVAAGQYVIPGSYTDTITVVVNYTFITFPGTVTTTMSVTATVQPTCLMSASNLTFGTYSGLLVNSTSTITLTCTNTTSYNVGLSAGVATGAAVTNRSMTGPASALLGYKLFSNSGRTLNWGNTVGSDTVTATGNGTAQPLTVYGQIPAGQFPRPGSYADTITATITY
jgi:spore coat protein U-like protein